MLKFKLVMAVVNYDVVFYFHGIIGFFFHICLLQRFTGNKKNKEMIIVNYGHVFLFTLLFF